jgi:hypothetical protein
VGRWLAAERGGYPGSEDVPLALGQLPERLRRIDLGAGEKFSAFHVTPPALAGQQVPDRSACGLGGGIKDQCRCRDLLGREALLELGPGGSDLVRAPKRPQTMSIRAVGHCPAFCRSARAAVADRSLREGGTYDRAQLAHIRCEVNVKV